MLWTVHNPDGTRTGPLPTERLIAALRDGAVSGHAWVRRPDDAGWSPLASFDAFADLNDPDARQEPPLQRVQLRFLVACGSVLFAFVVGMATF
jgi:hypothetical protein